MPAASSGLINDFLQSDDFDLDQVASISDNQSRQKQSGFPVLDPNRELYLGGDVQRYSRLDLNLGPDPEQDIPEKIVDFYSSEFQGDPDSIKFHQDLFGTNGAFDPLAEESKTMLSQYDLSPEVYAWGLKYAGYIPKEWGNASPLVLLDVIQELEAYIKINREAGRNPKIHTLLLDALIEYPTQDNISIAYETGKRLDLHLPQLVRLYKLYYKEPIFYEDILKAQYRFGRRESGILYRTHEDELAVLAGGIPEHEPIPYDTMVKTHEEQVINRFIVDVTPPKYRAIFRK